MSAGRVAFFLPSLAGGGAERVVVNLALGFAERDYRVDLVLQRAEGPYLSHVADRVRVVDLKAERMALSLFPLASYLRRRRPQAVLSALTHSNIIAVLAKKLSRVDTQIVIAEHNTLSVAARNAPGLRGRFITLPSRVVYPWADGIVAVSEGVADDLAETLRLRRARIETIYNPVVTPELLRKAKEVIDHRWFQPGEPPVVLGVGRLTQQKDFSTLLRAFASVRRERAARLLILGDGEERLGLESLIEELGITQDVHMPGFVDNPYKYMSRASVFVLSSSWEGLPTVLIEAMACGARVISTDCRSGPRGILGGGRYGLLVPVGDVDALASAVSHALAGGNGVMVPRAEAWSCFRVDAVVSRYEDIMLRRNHG